MNNFTNEFRHIVAVSPYHTGSHAYWANGLQKWSSHKVDLLTLPGRFWKWRMHGAAVTLADQFKARSWQPDHIIVTDMLDLTTFTATCQAAGLPQLGDGHPEYG